MNIGIDDIFNTELQIPVDNYIDKDLRKGFYSVDWWKIDRNTHLWGLPLLIYKQVWFSNKGIIKILNEKLINNLPSKTLALNYYSDLLPRQLLTLFNVKRLYIDDKGYLSANSLYQLEDFFNWLDILRNKGVFVNDMTANFMKVYFSISDKIIGPVNPWLHYFLIKKSEGSPVYLLDTYQYIMLNIFKQKQYKGDDHTKAVMKVALLISRKYGQKMAEIMKTKAAYNPAINNVNNMTHIFKNSKEMNLYWEEIFMPLWIKFWEEELSPKEMISEFKSRNK